MHLNFCFLRFTSLQLSQQAATGSLEENMLPLLRYWLSSRVNKVLMLCKFRAATSHFFFPCEWNFQRIGENFLPTKAAPIASLNLSIIHSSLSKNMTQEQNSMFQIESCAKQQVCIDDLSEERATGRVSIFDLKIF